MNKTSEKSASKSFWGSCCGFDQNVQSEGFPMEAVESYRKFWGTHDHTGILVRFLCQRWNSVPSISKTKISSVKDIMLLSTPLLEDGSKSSTLIHSLPDSNNFSIPNEPLSPHSTTIIFLFPSAACASFQVTWLGFHGSCFSKSLSGAPSPFSLCAFTGLIKTPQSGHSNSPLPSATSEQQKLGELAFVKCLE